MGASGVARAHKPEKTPIHSSAPLLPHSILQNQGKTVVLLVLPPMAPLNLIAALVQSSKDTTTRFTLWFGTVVQLKSLYPSANISTKTGQFGCIVIGLIKD